MARLDAVQTPLAANPTSQCAALFRQCSRPFMQNKAVTEGSYIIAYELRELEGVN